MPRCLICNTIDWVSWSIDLSAALCDEHLDAFNAWADNKAPDALFSDWLKVDLSP